MVSLFCCYKVLLETWFSHWRGKAERFVYKTRVSSSLVARWRFVKIVRQHRIVEAEAHRGGKYLLVAYYCLVQCQTTFGVRSAPESSLDFWLYGFLVALWIVCGFSFERCVAALFPMRWRWRRRFTVTVTSADFSKWQTLSISLCTRVVVWSLFPSHLITLWCKEGLDLGPWSW